MDNKDKIKITFEDLDKVTPSISNLTSSVKSNHHNPPPVGNRQWGSVQAVNQNQESYNHSTGSILNKSWFYMTLAGMLSAFLAWAICETNFSDGRVSLWGNYLLFPLMATFVSVSLVVSEHVSEHSYNKALSRGLIALFAGLVLGSIFSIGANIIYTVLLRLFSNAGVEIVSSQPAVWISRSIAWMGFGISSGLIYGLISQSKKKCLYGIIGGIAGAGIGGLFFDPISILAHGASLSRCIGIMFFGASTGLAISLVESALKDRWLYVSNGPLAGKQFILYKTITSLGSNQSNDIFLFKDETILPNHALIELRGQSVILNPLSLVYVSGQPIQSQRKLNSGDNLQIGKYVFMYQEKSQQK